MSVAVNWPGSEVGAPRLQAVTLILAACIRSAVRRTQMKAFGDAMESASKAWAAAKD